MSTNSSAADSGIAANASAAILVGRVLISILFILAGFGKLTAIGGTAGFFESLGLPMPTVTAVVVGLVEFFGGLAVLVGFKTRIAAILLAVFTLGATAVAHLDFSQAGNALMLQKNLGLVGGFIFLAVIGAGAYSIDGRGR
ncbi:DoxX family protein [Mesorhizobium sp. DCY119]|jgi:putative oxidoreductase|uniref:DoxX family protein n=1 Tax=Mesorhizobium sp. DCY119 TaxID=2108445 RepID=UPI000E6C5613|nr:DoxX family protein [Mesorhizobium sp. DCY119]RJG45709.1 DoxX family protein [Mesorhizobium sp. DCY119]